MSKKPSIAILLATYNGEEHLREQIDSILAQTASEWHLYIHDDGSTDKTIEILRRYAKDYSDKITWLNYPPQGGPYNNFMSLLKKVDSTYYMFSDQDDIWHADKIEKSMEAMNHLEQKHPDSPIVIHTDLRLVDKDKNIIASSFWQAAGIYPALFRTFEHRIVNIVTGCTMLFNHASKQMALRHSPNGHPMHDEWITLCTCANRGIVFPLAQQTIDYRQHDHNVLGAESSFNKKTIRYYFTHIKEIIDINKKNYLVLHSAGYGSIFTYCKNKIRNTIMYHLKYKHTT